MTIFSRSAMLALMTLSVSEAHSSGRRMHQHQPQSITSLNGEISLGSDIGNHLMHHARALNDNQQDMDLSFLTGYSVKFQGCHHVQQWNSNADDDNDVRIKTKRLVRFRLCPESDCTGDSTGCSTKYGDYVVDMNTFVAAFLNAKANDDGTMCQDAQTECYANCDEDAECIENCYRELGMYSCVENNGDNRRHLENDFDPVDYAACAQAPFGRRRQLSDGSHRELEDDDQYYIGPYCADQGGEIHLGLFTDDTCTTFAQSGESTFYNTMGYSLPFSDESLVTSLCLKCGAAQDDGDVDLNEMCEDIYYLSGKCETRMVVDYPNESSCTYIKGIKIIRKDGVIRTSSTKKSKAAAACIGLFLTIAVLLAGYVYYLRTKLGRARVNLAAASQTLT